MSMFPVWCKCTDGRWYKNPVWRSNRSVLWKWFVCLDDEEPPELVVRKTAQGTKPARMPRIPWFKATGEPEDCGERLFSKLEGIGGTGRTLFYPAQRVFGELTMLPPRPTVHDDEGVYEGEHPPGEGVFLDVTLS